MGCIQSVAKEDGVGRGLQPKPAGLVEDPDSAADTNPTKGIQVRLDMPNFPPIGGQQLTATMLQAEVLEPLELDEDKGQQAPLMVVLKEAELPNDEEKRWNTLCSYNILDTVGPWEAAAWRLAHAHVPAWAPMHTPGAAADHAFPPPLPPV